MDFYSLSIISSINQTSSKMQQFLPQFPTKNLDVSLPRTKSSGMWQQQRRTRPSRRFVCWLFMMIPLILIAFTCMDIDDLFIFVPRMHEGNMLWSWHFASGIGRLESRGSGWVGMVLVNTDTTWLISQRFLWSLKTALKKCSMSVDKNQRMPIVDLNFWGTPNVYLIWVWHANMAI